MTTTRHSDEQETLTTRQARQADIVLRTRGQRLLFLAGIVGFVLIAFLAGVLVFVY